jgi:hypothetical protein
MRAMNTRLAILAAMLLIIPSWLLGQQTETNAVEVLVSDQAGAAIKEAQIVVVPQPENSPRKVKTDDHGRVNLSLKAGEYKLSISAPAFTTTTQTLAVSNKDAASATNQPVKVMLNVAPSGFGGRYYTPDSLVVSDPYHSPIVFSPADFRALPHVTLKVHNAHTNADESYSGDPLEILLAKANAPVGKEFRKEALRTYLLASGTDGYSVLLSLAEVDSSFHAGQVIVADERDGQSLGKNGPFQLIVPGDNRPARWVHNLNSVRVQQAQ